MKSPTTDLHIVAETFIGIQFDDRASYKSYMAEPDVVITLPCGCKKEWQSKRDIPCQDDKCEHGYYFIKVGE